MLWRLFSSQTFFDPHQCGLNPVCRHLEGDEAHLEVFTIVNGDIGLFSDHEFEIIEQVCRNFAGNETGKGG
jgi:hypothetical protein